MGYISKLLFPAFLLICQLSLPISAYSNDVDPNELLLQKIKQGKSSSQFTKIKLVDGKPEQVAEPKKAVAAPVKKAATKAPRAYPIIEGRSSKPVENNVSKKISKKTPKKPVKKIAKKVLPKVEEKVEARIELEDDLNQIEPAAGSKKAITWFSSLSNGQRMTITFSKRPNVSLDEKTGEVVLRFNRFADYNPPLISQKFVDNFQSIEKLPGKNLTIRLKHNPDVERKITYNSRRVFIDLIENQPKEVVEKVEEEKPAEIKEPEIAAIPEVDVPKVSRADAEEVVAAVQKDPAQPAQKVQEETPTAEIQAVKPKESVQQVVEKELVYTSYDKNIVSKKSKNEEIYEFSFEDKTDAALFERFGNYWLVFHTKEPIGLPNIENSTMFKNVKKIPHPKAAVYKWEKNDSVFASAERKSGLWTIKFNKLIEVPVKFPLSLKKDGEEWFVNVPGINTSIDVKDDFTDETLTIFPSRNAGEGFAKRAIYRDFVVEKSALGIVLRKISDDSEVTFSKNQLRLTPSIMPRKLYAENDSEQKNEALMDFEQIKKFSRALEGDEGKELLSDLAPDSRGVVLFARKFYREAAVDLGSKVGFENGFMSSAAYFLSGNYRKVVADLERINIPQGRDENEFSLWQIAARQELLKRDPRAKVKLEIPDSFVLPENLKHYPVDIATSLKIPLAETAINIGKTDYAESVLNGISKKSQRRDLDYISYLRGKIKAKQGANENAIEMWENLANSTKSREIRARAIYAKVDTALEIGKIDETQAIAELEPVRILWRGGEVEFNTLFKIADLYTKTEQYGHALLAYKTAISAIPFHPKSDEVTENMREVYKLAMQKDFKDYEKSFDTLTLYYDYIELKPTGKEGEYMTIELAERLVGFDLIEEAAMVLEDFVKHVRDTEERALINTRIAILYYMLHQPEKALAKLDASESPEIPRYIQWQRKVLFVRILSEQGKYDTALSKVTRIHPQRASELRAEIYWFKQDWSNFLENFAKMDVKSDINIMKGAIAYSMLNDDAELQRFNEEYKQQMTGTRYETAFNFISYKNSIDYENLSESMGLDFAKQVIEDYKKDLRLVDFINREVASTQ